MHLSIINNNVHGVGVWISRFQRKSFFVNLGVGISRGVMASVAECISTLVVISNSTVMWFRVGTITDSEK